MIAVMQAHVDGKPIERRKVGSPWWGRVEAPNWNWVNCDYRIAPIAPGHNPKGLTVAQVGDGYRLLDEDEVDERWQGTPRHREIEAWFQRWDGSGWRGDTEEITYRTKLSREELARLREARPEPSVTIPKSEYERLQQAAEVVAKLQALALRPSPPPQPGPSDPASPTPTGQ